MLSKQQTIRIAKGKGFIAALDQSVSSTSKALELYGINKTHYSSESEMLNLIHQMRSRIITSPVFNSNRILAVILFKKTMNRIIENKLTTNYLWENKNIIPLLKIDQGLAKEKNDVQLMLTVSNLNSILEHAVINNVFGTKTRSVITAANLHGITNLLEQQFSIAEKVLSYGLIPIIEPEINIYIPDKLEAEKILLKKMTEYLNMLTSNQQVILKLSLPTKFNYYYSLIKHPRVIRVAALSGGYSRERANNLLFGNTGMIASFSRALTEGISLYQNVSDFTSILNSSIQSIHEASLDI